jgi:hypothetical protein
MGSIQARFFLLSWEGARLAQPHDPAVAASRRPAAFPRATGRGAPPFGRLLSTLPSRWLDLAAEQSSEIDREIDRKIDRKEPNSTRIVRG